MEIKRAHKWGRSIIFVRRKCRFCKQLYWSRKDELKKGLGKFCSSKCWGKSLAKYEYKKCIICKNQIAGKPSGKHKFCSWKCYLKARLDYPEKFNPTWKGGRMKQKDGYILVKLRKHPRSGKNGYVPEHQLVLENKLGRYLKTNEEVHHKNGIRDDNSIDNLELWSRYKQPPGARVQDRINWAIKFLEEYNYKITRF